VDTLLISVVVCTHNRAAFLARCLEALHNQELAPEHFEVIVVDDGSTDSTAAVTADWARQMPNLCYVAERARNLSLARNRGCQQARGAWVAYIDDDALPPPEHLARACQLIAEHDPDVLAGPVYPYYTSPKPRWFKDKYETKRFAETSGFSDTCRITGANFMIKKDVLLRLGQFDPAYGMQARRYVIGDERKVLELYRARTPRERQKVYYALECYVHHHVAARKMTLRAMLGRHYAGGRAMVRIFRDVKGIHPQGRRVLRQAWRWPGRLARALRAQARQNGLRNADFVEAAALAWYDLGWIVESARQVLQRRLARTRRLTTADQPGTLTEQ
jgi:glycosyltransferase involved in cell wall biosynthesis